MDTSASNPIPASPAAVTHYENFPVASWLCPPRLRPPIGAIYHFARTADDIADEGDASADQRLADLAQMRADLQAMARGESGSGRWPGVFPALKVQWQIHALPLNLLDDLADAFMQDVRMTRDGTTYADRAQLLDYCRRSANPVGRLLLHLYGVTDARSLAQSDAICSALQLINFWQDLGVDLRRRRHYLSDADCAAHGVSRAALQALDDSPAVRALVAELVRWARSLMLEGAPLVHRLRGRVGWELRLVVQGGLRILDHIEALDYDTLRHRPVIRARDAVPMVWRAWRM